MKTRNTQNGNIIIKGTVPVEVIEAEDLIGRLSMGIYDDCVLAKSVDSEVIWSVAPLFIIQGLVNTKLIEASRKRDVPVTFA